VKFFQRKKVTHQRQAPPRPPERRARGHVPDDGGHRGSAAARARGDPEPQSCVKHPRRQQVLCRAAGQRRVQRREREEGAEVLAHQHGVEAHDRDRRGLQGADRNEGRVRHVEPRGQPPREHAGEAMDRQEVDDEGVPPPRRHHVEVGQRERRGPAEGARLRFSFFRCWWWRRWWDRRGSETKRGEGTALCVFSSSSRAPRALELSSSSPSPNLSLSLLSP